MKFKADVNGSIAGIRFYKGTANTGTHIGSLWTTSGTKLARRPSATRPASGGNRSPFASPVTITAGTVYVASYLAPAATTPRTAATSPPPASTTRRCTRCRRGQRRQRRLRVRRHKRLPQQQLRRHQLLGRRRVRYGIAVGGQAAGTAWPPPTNRCGERVIGVTPATAP